MFIDAHTHKKRKDSGDAVLLDIETPVVESNAVHGRNKTWFSAGIHPWNISGVSEDELERRLLALEEAAAKGCIDAVGECGLDRAIDTHFEVQTRVFERHIRLSDKFHLPLVVHCVRAYPEIMSAAKKSRSSVPWILHAFNGNSEILAAFLKHERFKFSFGPAILQHNAKTADVMRSVPLSRLFLETDDEDVEIERIYVAASTIFGIPPAKLSDTLADNWSAIFPK